MQVDNAGVLRSAVDNVVNRRLPHVAHLGELVYGNPSLLAEAANPPLVQFNVVHNVPPVLSLPKFG